MKPSSCLVVLALLAGCTGGTGGQVGAVHLSLVGDRGLNPDPTGTANPAQVHVYALTVPDRLGNADYFQLQSKESDVLGDTLAGRELLTLHPGETRTLDLKLSPAAHWIGVTVGYRDIDHATWRATAAAAATLVVSVGANRVAIAK